MLYELANKLGISEGYYLQDGTFVKTSEKALKKIIDAMGFDTTHDVMINRYISDIDCINDRPLATSVVIESDHNDFILDLITKGLTLGELEIIISMENGTHKTITKQITQDIIDDGHMEISLMNYDLGYHQISLVNNLFTQNSHLILCPSQAYMTDWAKDKEKKWGVALQLYSLKSKNNLGFGNFSDLQNISKMLGSVGATTIGLNPIHAQLTELNSQNSSPYSPTSRIFLNPMYIDVTKVPCYNTSKKVDVIVNSVKFKERLAIAKNSNFINYKLVQELTFEIFEAVFSTFKHVGKRNHTYQSFLDFCNNTEDLEKFALYSALAKHLNNTDWSKWSAGYQDINSKKVSDFKNKNEKLIELFKFIQWQAFTQLGEVATELKKNGIKNPLYLDLAIGTQEYSYCTWADRHLNMHDVTIGSVPDELNPKGQNWNLAPLNPYILQQTGYKYFIKVIQSNMQYASQLRIDHIIGLNRMFIVPKGVENSDGAYVDYPKDDLLSILCLESIRNNCTIVAESLGNNEKGFNEYLNSKNIFTCKVFMFERWNNSTLFKRPETYTPLTVASTTNHDLPTVAGFYMGSDISHLRRLGIGKESDLMEKEEQRHQDRKLILDALNDQNIKISMDQEQNKEHKPLSHSQNMENLTLATQRFIAKSSSLLNMVNLNDIMLTYDPINIPSTTTEYQNWSIKIDIEDKQLKDMLVNIEEIMKKEKRNSLDIKKVA